MLRRFLTDSTRIHQEVGMEIVLLLVIKLLQKQAAKEKQDLMDLEIQEI
jgi:hypothetical protein